MIERAARGYVLVVSLVPLDASTVLFFTNLADRVPLRVVGYPGRIASALSGASAVIFIRGLFEFREAIWCARALGIPSYYFLDDNFMLIRREPELYGRFYDRYTDERVREKLRGFTGVLLATEALMQYFRDARLHERLVLYPPAAVAPMAPPNTAPRTLTVAFFGGVHRREAFVRHVFPAVCRVAEDMTVRLLAAGFDEGQLPPAPQMEIVYPPYQQSYVLGLQRMAEYGVDILVHPSARTENNAYKNPHVLINARALGAAAIFSNAPPYDAIATAGIALISDNTEDAWHAALTRLALDAQLRCDLKTRLADYCARHFSGDSNVGIVDEMLHAHAPPGALTRLGRSIVAAPLLGFARVLRRIKNQFQLV